MHRDSTTHSRSPDGRYVGSSGVSDLRETEQPTYAPKMQTRGASVPLPVVAFERMQLAIQWPCATELCVPRLTGVLYWWEQLANQVEANSSILKLAPLYFNTADSSLSQHAAPSQSQRTICIDCQSHAQCVASRERNSMRKCICMTYPSFPAPKE